MNVANKHRQLVDGFDAWGRPLPAGQVCTKCHEDKPFAEFPPNKRLKRGTSSWCRDCHRAATRAWYDRRLRATS